VSWAFRPSTTTAPRPGRATARSSPRRRRSASRARSTTRSFPRHAVELLPEQAGIGLRDVDLVAFYDKPLLKFERLLETYLAFAPRGFKSFSMAIPVWLREKLFLKDLLVGELAPLGGGQEVAEARMVFSEHHLSHAASAFYPSPFDEAAVLTMDGVGEWATTRCARQRQPLEVLKEIHFPHSIGLLYSAFTYYTGFKVNSGEYKVMGLAPYGEPVYAKQIYDHLLDLKPDGTFR
jgi:carbamoyltransferase